MSTKTGFYTAALLLVAALQWPLVAGAAASAGERRIAGQWRVVQMIRGGKPVDLPPDVEMTMAFRLKDHTWLFTIETKKRSFSEAGTWRLDGSKLVTQTDDGSKVERMRVSAIGKDAIELKKTDERLVLRKQR